MKKTLPLRVVGVFVSADAIYVTNLEDSTLQLFFFSTYEIFTNLN